MNEIKIIPIEDKKVTYDCGGYEKTSKPQFSGTEAPRSYSTTMKYHCTIFGGGFPYEGDRTMTTFSSISRTNKP